MFCEGTMQPKLDLIGQALTRDLGRRYGPDVADRVSPNARRATRTSAARTTSWTRRLGLRTYNEIRRVRGLRPVRRPAIRQADSAAEFDRLIVASRGIRTNDLNAMTDESRTTPFVHPCPPCHPDRPIRHDHPSRPEVPPCPSTTPIPRPARFAVESVEHDRPARHLDHRPGPGRRHYRAGRASERRGVPAQPGRALGAQAVACRRSGRASGSTIEAAADHRRDAVRPRRAVRAKTCSGSMSRAFFAAGRSASCRARRRDCRRPASSRTADLRIAEWDLLEYSAVPMPENPRARHVAVREGDRPGPDFRRLARASDDVLAGLDSSCARSACTRSDWSTPRPARLSRRQPTFTSPPTAQPSVEADVTTLPTPFPESVPHVRNPFTDRIPDSRRNWCSFIEQQAQPAVEKAAKIARVERRVPWVTSGPVGQRFGRLLAC